MKTYAVLN